MPYASKAQSRAMHAKANKGEISKKVIREWDEKTKAKKGGFAKLPERVKKSFYKAGQNAASIGFGMKPPSAPGTAPNIPAAPTMPTIPDPGKSRSAVMEQMATSTFNTPTMRMDQGTTFPIMR